MKKNILTVSVYILLLFFVSCKLSKDDLTEEVKSSMEETWKKEGLSDIKIEDFTLTHVKGNEYSGLLEFIKEGEHFKSSVKVLYDGESMQWEILD